MKNNAFRLTALCFCLFALRAAATTYYADVNSPNPTPPYTNWSTAATNIQDAVNETANGDLVLVNPGAYGSPGYTSPDGAPAVVLVTNAITLQSVSGAQYTSISGSNSMRCIEITAPGATLIGFTVAYGHVDFTGTYGTGFGGDIQCAAGNDYVLNCTVSGAYSGWSGADSGGTLSNCTLVANSSGWGGGAGQSTLINCVLSNNTAAYNGGGAYQSTLTNCLIIDNGVDISGGGVASCSIYNCTVVQNNASNGDGGIDGASSAFNSIIYYNTGLGPGQNFDPGMTLNNCCTIPAPAGSGNITDPPLFVNANSDFHLQPGSPCINLGNNAYIAVSDDLDGNPRLVDAVVDIGAYEYQAPVSLTAAIQVDNTNVAIGFPLALQAVVRGGIADFISWDFGDGTTATNQATVSHVWPSAGVYTVTLLVSNEYLPGTAEATLAVNAGTPPVCYVNANGVNPVPPYVSWNTAATNIQDAIDAAYDGGTVLVTNGVYQFGGESVSGDGLTNRAAITKPITVQSINGPLLTTIQGYPSLNSNAVRCAYMASGSSLIGFTLVNGSTLNSGYAEQEFGAGIYCASSNATILNCILATNSAGYGGGGVYQGSLSNCVLNNNSAGNSGGGAADSSLNGCSFTANIAANGGGAIGCYVANSMFNTNNGSDGGAANSCTLLNCVLTNNVANANGGGAYQSSLTNCLIIGNNSGQNGGGVCSSIVDNCTIVYNFSINYGGVDGSSAVYNSILYYNNAFWTSGDTDKNYQSGMTLYYTCTLPMPAGPGNITNAPLFLNITNDFHLQPNSACINMGTNSYVAASSDLDGNPRIVDGTVDMGAYEYQVPIPMTVSIESDSTNVAAGFPLQLQTVIGQGSATYVLWDFGDGTTVTNQFSPTHIWSSPGTYTVTVTVSNNFVPEATAATLTINVVPLPFCYVNANGKNPVVPYLSWATAATNIQDAIDVSSSGDTIIVTDGVYQVGGEIVPGYSLTNRVVINKPLTVQSVNGPGSTFIWGGPGVRCVFMTNNAALIGFTLANGVTFGGTANANDDDGGGVWCASTNNDVVSNCVITANTAYNQGGGAYQGTLLNCTVLGNQALDGGGVANALVTRSLIISNTAVSLLFSSFTPYGGGTYDCAVSSSAFAGNSAGYDGGGAYGGSTINCTITENSAGFAGGGTASCSPTNCIIYYNKIFSNQTGSTNSANALYYCCTTPKPPPFPPGNITNEPVLASISHISPNSPCRGAGDPAMTIGTDIDGNAWANPPSIGCSEPYPGSETGSMTVAISTIYTNQPPGYPLTFVAGIVGPVESSVWDFADGTTVTNEPYAVHQWTAPGIYPVTLTAYNDSYPAGVTATLVMDIAVPAVNYVNLANPNPLPPYSHWSTAATNIQDAVGLAAPGSLVLVTNPIVIIPGGDGPNRTNIVAIYQYGGMSVKGTQYRVGITNPITVQSVNGPAFTYIYGSSSGFGGGVYVTNGAVLSGFTVTNAWITAASTNATVTNCTIIHSAAGGAFSGTFNNCALVGNSDQGSYGGAAQLSVLNNCLITNNSSEYGGGVCGGILNNCIIVSNTATYGGGVYASATYPIVLNNCMISNNTAEYGGGVYNAFSGNSSFTNCILNNCLVANNSTTLNGFVYGGGVYAAEINDSVISSNRSGYVGGGVESGLLNNCLLTGNTALAEFGGGADGSYAGNPNSTMLNNCTLVANQGGGAYLCTLNGCTVLQNVETNAPGAGVGSSVLNDCLVISNTTLLTTSGFLPTQPYGGGAYSSELTNCILAYNLSPTNGGGAYASTLVNCTVVANSAAHGGGVANCLADNCIIYRNTGGDFYPTTSQYPLNYCCVSTPGAYGIRDITNQPLFVSPGNFHLQSSSPCINSGNNAYITAATDLDGNPRIVGGTVDIGAYEYQTPTSVISYAYLQQYGLPTDGSVDFKDLDGTAFDVYQDWIAGLNPTNPASVLAMLTPVTTNTATGVTVTWQSVSGIPYFLQRSTNLTSQPPFSTIQNSIIGQTNTTSYTDTSATNGVPYFYRVGVVAP